MFTLKCVETEQLYFSVIKYSLIILKVDLRYFCPNKIDVFLNKTLDI